MKAKGAGALSLCGDSSLRRCLGNPGRSKWRESLVAVEEIVTLTASVGERIPGEDCRVDRAKLIERQGGSIRGPRVNAPLANQFFATASNDDLPGIVDVPGFDLEIPVGRPVMLSG